MDRVEQDFNNLSDEQRRYLRRTAQIAAEVGHPNPQAVAAKAIVESSVNPDARNGSFVGLLQVGPQVLDDLVQENLLTRAEAKQIDLTRFEDNARVGALYDGLNLRRFDGNQYLADIAYNAGPTITRSAARELGANATPEAFAQHFAAVSDIYSSDSKRKEVSRYQPNVALAAQLIAGDPGLGNSSQPAPVTSPVAPSAPPPPSAVPVVPPTQGQFATTPIAPQSPTPPPQTQSEIAAGSLETSPVNLPTALPLPSERAANQLQISLTGLSLTGAGQAPVSVLDSVLDSILDQV